MSGFTQLDLFRTHPFDFQREYTIRHSELLVQRFHNSENFLDRLSVTFLLIIIPAFGLAAIPKQYLFDTRFNVFSFYWNASFGIFLIFIAFAVVSNYLAKSNNLTKTGYVFSVAIITAPILALLTVYIQNYQYMWYLEFQTVLLILTFRLWIDDTLLEISSMQVKEVILSAVILFLSLPWIFAYFGKPLPSSLTGVFEPVHMGKHHGFDGVVTLLIMINFGIPVTKQITVPSIKSILNKFSVITVVASAYQFLDDFLHEQLTARGIINYQDKILALPELSNLNIVLLILSFIIWKVLHNYLKQWSKW